MCCTLRSVVCIGKGNARTRFEFGVKVSLATTNRAAPCGQLVISARTDSGACRLT